MKLPPFAAHLVRRFPRYLLNIATAFGIAAFGAPADAATVPGVTAGDFGVSDQGAATYSIPIALPPGTGGLVPSVALSYSSQGGNGLVGVGWSISGMSAITRCPQTQWQDKVRGSLKYDETDRLCMDGQRLILVSGGSYLAGGAEYRTEAESYSKITAHGSAAGGAPQYFIVKTKAGQTLTFGGTAADSPARIVSHAPAKGTAGVVTAWLLQRVEDTVGNYMEYDYGHDTGAAAVGGGTVVVDYFPKEIRYTGHTSSGATPYAKVSFEYTTDRQDSVLRFPGGHSAKAVSKAQQHQDLFPDDAGSGLPAGV